jgi:hypothetical protein
MPFGQKITLSCLMTQAIPSGACSPPSSQNCQNRVRRFTRSSPIPTTESRPSLPQGSAKPNRACGAFFGVCCAARRDTESRPLPAPPLQHLPLPGERHSVDGACRQTPADAAFSFHKTRWARKAPEHPCSRSIGPRRAGMESTGARLKARHGFTRRTTPKANEALPRPLESVGV